MELNKGKVGPENDQLQQFAEDGDNLEAYLKVVLDAKARAEELEAHLGMAKQAERTAEQSLVTKMLEQGVDNFRALSKTITRTEDIRPSVLADDRPKQFEWLREIGAGALISETVNAASFGALVRNDFIKAGKEVPEFVKVYREPRLLIRTVAT
jgi:hypothetical protein